MKDSKLFKISIIAAIYVVLCLMLEPLSFGPIQFRISEILCLLSIEYPFAIIGCSLGCLISNAFLGGLGIIDAIFGSLATLISCYLAYKLRNRKYNNYPIVSMLMFVIVNGIIIGIELGYIYDNLAIIPLSILEVAVSEAVVIFLIGLPMYNKLIKVIK